MIPLHTMKPIEKLLLQRRTVTNADGVQIVTGCIRNRRLCSVRCRAEDGLACKDVQQKVHAIGT